MHSKLRSIPVHLTLFATFAPLLIAAGPIEVAAIPGANLQRPNWSPDGQTLSFEANYHDRKAIETYVGSAKHATFSLITPMAATTSSLSTGFQRKATTSLVVHELSWSPAAYDQYIVSATSALGDYDLFIKDAGPIGVSPSADGGPVWSPSGDKIAFTSARTGDGDLYLIDIHALNQPPIRLTTQEEASEVYANWSSDGKQLVYVTHTKEGDNLWWLPSVTHEPVRLTRQAGSHTRPRFSPAGSDIAYYSKDGQTGQIDLFVLTIGSPADPKRVASNVVANTAGPAWSPDGMSLVYASNDDAQYDPLFAVHIKSPESPMRLQIDTVGHSDLAIAPGPDNTWNIAYIAQGRKEGTVRGFKRLYTLNIPIPTFH